MTQPPRSASPVFREPSQGRSRESWERVVRAGLEILVESGASGVTIQAVCNRANVSPAVIYARVDGIAGLFWAIYERGFDEVRRTYLERFARATEAPARSRERVAETVAALSATFDENIEFLRPIIRQAVGDPVLRARGSEDSKPFVQRMAELIRVDDPGVAFEVARTLMAEATYRVLFEDRFLTDLPETVEQFRARLEALAWARLASAS